MQRLLTFLVLIIANFLFCKNLLAQNYSNRIWDLNNCINYALENNIQVKQKKLSVTSNELDLSEDKSAWLPSLNASVSENLSNSKDKTNADSWAASNGTSFSLTASMPIYQGGTIKNNIRKSQLSVEQANVEVEITQKSIILSIVQAYLDVLYTKESVDYYGEVVLASQKQVERSKDLFNAGSIVRKDLAQMEAQLASDNYSLTVARNNLTSRTTDLKQLLEIPVADTFAVSFPEVQVIDSLASFPSKLEAINAAISIMPEIRNSQVNNQIAEVNFRITKSGYLPSLSLNAGYSTDYSSSLSGGFSNQLSNNQLQKVGLTLNVPIFNRFSTKTSVQQSKIGMEQARLSALETEKNLQQQVETIYQDAVAGIYRYKSAKTQMELADESYRLSEQQFNLGMINAVELLKVKTSLLNSKMELIQSKYSAILNLKILDYYMGKTITL
ncbi:MAG TPA: TolC family protein [Tenuifilaceae bacterium]|mgnify:CR=1 FL=1|nr:TolC family protein [Tenuifilaceae bacterium]HPI43910.1 TolC family protein [Tenuifilaceae bacterium]HPV55901.1 TolC family protein [Tenuifilaceae bacterium]